MTDAELGRMLREAYYRHQSPAWLDTDDNPLTWYLPRVSERWAATARDVRMQLEFIASQREQTAATILAALLVARDIRQQRDAPQPEDVLERLIPNAVGIADALRAELAKGGG